MVDCQIMNHVSFWMSHRIFSSAVRYQFLQYDLIQNLNVLDTRREGFNLIFDPTSICSSSWNLFLVVFRRFYSIKNCRLSKYCNQKRFEGLLSWFRPKMQSVQRWAIIGLSPIWITFYLTFCLKLGWVICHCGSRSGSS